MGRPYPPCCSRRAAFAPWSDWSASTASRRQRRPTMEAAASRIWRRLPADAHAAVAELWAELLLRRLPRYAPDLNGVITEGVQNRPIADMVQRDARKLAVLSCGQPWRFGQSFRTGVAVAPARAGTDLVAPCYRA